MLQRNMNALPKILKDYKNYLIAVKGCSNETIKAFSSDLMQFFGFLEKFKDIHVPIKDFNVFILLDVKEYDIIAFLVYLNHCKDNSPYTRQRKVTAIRSFYKWIFTIFPISKNKINPTDNLPYVRKVERLPKVLSFEQAKKIQNIFNLSNSRFPERNNAILTLFLTTGIRLTELVNINVNDLNLDDNSIVILGKNKQERIVYINNYCKNMLQEYIKKRNLMFKKASNSPLFLNRYGNRIGGRSVENICHKAYQLIGLDNFGFRSHALRHTAATILYTYVKDDILLIKDFLGHNSLASTQIYTHLNNNRVKEAVDKNPLNFYKKEGD